MGNIALHQRLNFPGARLGQYNGVETTLNFGDLSREFAALRTQCGIFDLSWRSKIIVAGKDRVRWLHNMVTNNVRDLALNRGNYNFVLNVQGRILGDMYIYNRGESLVLDTDSTQVEPLLTSMKRYIIMDKVEMDVTPIIAFGICGPKSVEKLAAAGFDVQGMEPLEIREVRSGHLLARGPLAKPGWYELWSILNDDSGAAVVPGWAGGP